MLEVIIPYTPLTNLVSAFIGTMAVLIAQVLSSGRRRCDLEEKCFLCGRF